MTCCDHNTIVPPFRFSVVEKGIFRGGYPTLKNFRFLRRLRLKTIIALTPEAPTADLIAFAGGQENPVNVVHFPACTVILDHSVIEKSIEILVDQEQHPVYIHGLDGATSTGMVIMFLRRLQHWGLSCILHEFSRFTLDQTVGEEETAFLIEAKLTINIPNSPSWLNTTDISEHPYFNVKHPKQQTQPSNPDSKDQSELTESETRYKSKLDFKSLDLSWTVSNRDTWGIDGVPPISLSSNSIYTDALHLFH